MAVALDESMLQGMGFSFKTECNWSSREESWRSIWHTLQRHQSEEAMECNQFLEDSRRNEVGPVQLVMEDDDNESSSNRIVAGSQVDSQTGSASFKSWKRCFTLIFSLGPNILPVVVAQPDGILADKLRKTGIFPKRARSAGVVRQTWSMSD